MKYLLSFLIVFISSIICYLIIKEIGFAWFLGLITGCIATLILKTK